MQQFTHAKFGQGTLIQKTENTYVLRFSHGIEECPKNECVQQKTIFEKIKTQQFDNALKTKLKTQAALIQSINDSWGVFSKSSVDLLPHQLWVCNTVLKKWPFRYLIADDVGLGKTVEAGLILWPLLSSQKVRRLLILTPAPLVEQWQYRLRKMFDIRLTRYTTEQDSPRSDFWNSNSRIVASFPTISTDNKGRQERFLNAEEWDLIIVDEAHHMHFDEQRGKTQSYTLFEKIIEANKVKSILFFTGTPHRGFDFSFWELMRLLDGNIFGGRKNSTDQYLNLPDFFIRNNKQNVTDMHGNKLFKPIKQSPKIFQYTTEEMLFYELMSSFIESGRAYANSLKDALRNQVQLVLISLQKIASSSIKAVCSALETRRDTLLKADSEKEKNQTHFSDLIKESNTDSPLEDLKLKDFKLMEKEVEAINELIALAHKIKKETRIFEVIEIIKKNYPTEQILLFTEYKVTQALMVSALMDEWGEKSTGFINGDNVLQGVVLQNNKSITLRASREDSASNFNLKRNRFLVSTEAAGEGIDLQENCHVLIHIDLPWNPMKLHQRVGRINRYGQKEQVEVISLRNPDTVESRIWDILEDKISKIKLTFDNVMEDPEDLFQLVLGMQDNSYFTNLFSNGLQQKKENLSSWFNEETQTLGNQSIYNTVQSLIGNASKFNLTGLKDVPPFDLPDLETFFIDVLNMERRRVSKNNKKISFITPESWTSTFGVKPRYSDLIFQRKIEDGVHPDSICGVGHILFQKALESATNSGCTVCTINSSESFIVYRVFDKITYSRGIVSTGYIIVVIDKKGNKEIIDECDFFEKLNELEIKSVNTNAQINTDFILVPNNLNNIIKEKFSFFREPGTELYSVFIGGNQSS